MAFCIYESLQAMQSFTYKMADECRHWLQMFISELEPVATFVKLIGDFFSFTVSQVPLRGVRRMHAHAHHTPTC